jgi:SAM-dependent methyltransferase
MVRLLRRRFGDRPSVTCVEVEGSHLRPWADGSIDAVFSYDVFVHLSIWNIHLYLEEIARVLRPGGRAVLHHANLRSELGWKRFVRDSERLGAGQPPSARFTPMTPELMAELATRSGLKVLAARTDAVPRDCITVLARPG